MCRIFFCFRSFFGLSITYIDIYGYKKSERKRGTIFKKKKRAREVEQQGLRIMCDKNRELNEEERRAIGLCVECVIQPMSQKDEDALVCGEEGRKKERKGRD